MSQQDEFQERLNRIRNQGQRTGAPGGGPGQPVLRKAPSVTAEIGGNLLYPLSLAGAFLLGILAVCLGRYIRYHLMDGAAGEHGSDIDLVITGAMSCGASFVLAQMFRLSSKEHLSLQAAGIFVALCTFHNLFHWMPGPMEKAFSPEYVQMMQDLTPPNTAIFRGVVLDLVDRPAEPADPADPASPTLIGEGTEDGTRPRIRRLGDE